MAKKGTEKDRKNRTTSAVAEPTGRFDEPRASDQQPGRGQAVRDWFSSSFGRKARGLILFL